MHIWCLVTAFGLMMTALFNATTAQDLACPTGEKNISREQYCDQMFDCPNQEDNSTLYPDGSCVALGATFLFYCGSSGDFVWLTSLCDGVIDCSNAVDETNPFCPGRSTCSNRCLNGGTCVAGGTCVCAPGWTGTLCDTAVCSVPCENGGTCTAPDTCTCSPPWTGPVCCNPVCSSECLNGGVCIFNRILGETACACVDNYIGPYCEKAAMFTCMCLNGECPGVEYDPSKKSPSGCNCTQGFVCMKDTNSAGGDPHFLVSLPDNSNLCFSVQGECGFAFNLVTSKTLVINAVFIKPPPRLQQWASVMGEIGVLYMRKPGSTVRMHFKLRDRSVYISGYGVLDAKRVSSVILKGDHLQVTNRNTTHSWASTVFVSVGEELQFMVFYNHDNLDLVWSDVNKFNHSSHGILGQFFNKGTKVDKVNKLLVLPNRPPIPVTMETTKPEVHHKTECWRPVTPGYQGQGLLEGEYPDYIVDYVFATDFKFSS